MLFQRLRTNALKSKRKKIKNKFSRNKYSGSLCYTNRCTNRIELLIFHISANQCRNILSKRSYVKCPSYYAEYLFKLQKLSLYCKSIKVCDSVKVSGDISVVFALCCQSVGIRVAYSLHDCNSI